MNNKDHLCTLLFKYFSLFVYFEGNLVNKSFEIKTGFKTIFKGLKKKKSWFLRRKQVSSKTV